MVAWNPASEFHKLIEQALEVDRSLSAEEAWRTLFDIGTFDDFLVVLGAVTRLPGQVRAFVRAAERDEEELLLSGLDDLEDVLRHQRLAQPWSSVADKLEALAVARATLLHAASAIRRGGLEVDIDADELESLILDLANLIEAVSSSEIPLNLRELLVSQLRRAARAAGRCLAPAAGHL